MSYPLPKASQDLLQVHRGAISNLGLYLTRYTPRQGAPSWEISDEEKKMRQAQAILAGNQELLQAYTRRWAAAVAATPGARQFTAVTQSRCVVGLGAKGTREVGLSLHGIHGFPLIPGSGLKGLTRAYALLTQATELAPQLGLKIADVLAIVEGDKKAQKDHANHVDTIDEAFADALRCYGTQEGAGSVCFFDAVPAGAVQVELDIMNPHHPAYYRQQGRQAPPADYESPVPVYFLAVAAGVSFRFAVAPRWANAPDAEADVARTITSLQSALSELGVGGKTTSGYGMFYEFQAVG
jgi:CRISPR-associated protein Cmr6